MNTTPEMTLLNYCEVFGHKETARKMREIVDKQRIPWDKIRIEAAFTPARDANASCENIARKYGLTILPSEPQIAPTKKAYLGRKYLSPELKAAATDLFAGNARITPEQARYAYDNAIQSDARAPDDPGYTTSRANQQLRDEALTIRCGNASVSMKRPRLPDLKFDYEASKTQIPAKHTFIHLSGATRTENACL